MQSESVMAHPSSEEKADKGTTAEFGEAARQTEKSPKHFFSLPSCTSRRSSDTLEEWKASSYQREFAAVLVLSAVPKNSSRSTR
jgi:hypothetical protein